MKYIYRIHVHVFFEMNLQNFGKLWCLSVTSIQLGLVVSDGLMTCLFVCVSSYRHHLFTLLLLPGYNSKSVDEEIARVVVNGTDVTSTEGNDDSNVLEEDNAALTGTHRTNCLRQTLDSQPPTLATTLSESYYINIIAQLRLKK